MKSCATLRRGSARATRGGDMLPESRTNLDTPISRDPLITDRPRTFSRVAEEYGVSAATIDGFIERLSVAVLIVDRDGRVVYANEAARALRVERLDAIQWAITRALLTEAPVREDELEVALPGEPRRWLSVYVTPVRVLGHGVNSALLTVTDQTARRRMDSWTPVIESLVNL